MANSTRVETGTGPLARIGLTTAALAAPRKAIRKKITEWIRAILARLRLVIMAKSCMGSGSTCARSCGRPAQRQLHSKLRSLPQGAAHVDLSPMLLDDAAGERKTQSGAVSLGGIERAENVGEVLGRNPAAGIGHDHQRRVIVAFDFNRDPAGPIDVLDRVQQQVQQ